MRKYLLSLYIIFFVSVVSGFLCSCGDDSNGNGASSQNKILMGTKWTSTNWDYGVGDDWVSTLDETYNIYFYSETEGLFYYGRKDNDSDFGSSMSRSVAHFTYNVEGNVVKLDYINNPERFSSTLNLTGNEILMNGIRFAKGTINKTDNDWLNTLQGRTGACKWYYDLSKCLYVRGAGDMADYAKYSDTPWGKNDRTINYVEIQEGVTSIGSCAFANPSIAEVYITSEAKLRKIGDSAFSGTCISKVSLPDEITVIGAGAFSGCEYLTNVSIPTDIVEIGDYAFNGCKSASLTLTKNLKRVGAGAFGECEITSWTDSKVLEYIGGAAFGKIKTKELDLPTIKELGHLAFYNTSIEKIHIGFNLQKVTGIPFVNLSSSGTVTIDAQTPLALKDDFIDENCVKNWNLVVPNGCENNYKAAPYWKNFKSVAGGTSGNPGDSGNSGDTDSGYDPNKPEIETGEAIPGEGEIEFSGRFNAKWNIVERIKFQMSEFPDYRDLDRTGYEIELTYKELAELGRPRDFSMVYKYLYNVFRFLKPHTKYYYRAVLVTRNGYSYGETKYFTSITARAPSDLTYTIGGEKYKMIKVTGCPSGDFYIMQTELPHSLDITIEGMTIPRIDRNKDGHVIKSEFRTFLEEIRRKTNGIGWRLPTPEEWKYAAKGGDRSNGTLYSGSSNISDVAWHKGNSNGHVHNGALKKPNELGIYDMSGNYAELTNTKWDDQANIDGDFYGGCWNDAASQCTVTSYKLGDITGNVEGSTLKEKNAFNGNYITVRLVYSTK